MNSLKDQVRILPHPSWVDWILRVSEACAALAAVLALLSILDQGPISLTLFMTLAQACIVLGVASYLFVTLFNFLRQHGVSQLHFPAGEIIFREGDPGDYVYVIISGQIEIVKEKGLSEPMVLAVLGPGQYVGEMALISNAPRTATVRTLTAVEAVTMGRVDFSTLYLYLPRLKKNVDRIMRVRGARADQDRPG